MALRSKIVRHVKRITRTTYDAPFGAKLTSAFGFKGRDNPYSNETTWQQIYKEQPYIRGALDTIVKAVVQQWSIENISKKKAKPSETSLAEHVERTWKMPEIMFTTKLSTAALKLIMDSVIISESSRIDENFYNLNKQDWTVKWDGNNRQIDRVQWRKASNPLGSNATDEKPDKILNKFEFAIGSVHDPDTNLWQLSIMETLVNVANLFWQVDKHNIGSFSNGGVPSMLFMLDEKTSDPIYNQFIEAIKNTKASENITSRGVVTPHRLAGFNKDMEYEAIVRNGVQAIMSSIGISSYMMALADKTGGEKNETNVFTNTVHFFQNLMDGFVTWNMHNIWTKFKKLDVDVDPDDEAKGKVKIHGRPKSNPVRNLVFKFRKWVNPREQAALHKLYRDMRVLSVNEIRSDIGKEHSDEEGADEVLYEGTKQPAGNVGGDQPMREGEDQKPNSDDSGELGNPQNSDVQDAEDNS